MWWRLLTNEELLAENERLKLMNAALIHLVKTYRKAYEPHGPKIIPPAGSKELSVEDFALALGAALLSGTVAEFGDATD